MENEPMPVEAEDLIKRIEEDKSKKLLEVLNDVIKLNSAIKVNELKFKVELLVFNPPNYSKGTSSTVIVTPEKIENGYLHVKTEHKTNVSIDLLRVKRVIVWPSWDKKNNDTDDTKKM
jgi:hypothetical protein